MNILEQFFYSKQRRYLRKYDKYYKLVRTPKLLIIKQQLVLLEAENKELIEKSKNLMKIEQHRLKKELKKKHELELKKRFAAASEREEAIIKMDQKIKEMQKKMEADGCFLRFSYLSRGAFQAKDGELQRLQPGRKTDYERPDERPEDEGINLKES